MVSMLTWAGVWPLHNTTLFSSPFSQKRQCISFECLVVKVTKWENEHYAPAEPEMEPEGEQEAARDGGRGCGLAVLSSRNPGYNWYDPCYCSTVQWPLWAGQTSVCLTSSPLEPVCSQHRLGPFHLKVLVVRGTAAHSALPLYRCSKSIFKSPLV